MAEASGIFATDYDRLKAIWISGHGLSDNDVTDLIWWADQFRAKLAAAERVIEAARELQPALHMQEPHRSRCWQCGFFRWPCAHANLAAALAVYDEAARA